MHYHLNIKHVTGFCYMLKKVLKKVFLIPSEPTQVSAIVTCANPFLNSINQSLIYRRKVILSFKKTFGRKVILLRRNFRPKKCTLFKKTFGRKVILSQKKLSAETKRKLSAKYMENFRAKPSKNLRSKGMIFHLLKSLKFSFNTLKVFKTASSFY